MINIIKKYNLPYKYVGNGDLIINGKNPDFVNINGEKKLIEVGCNFYKERMYGSLEKYKIERKKHFAKYGWDTIFCLGDKLSEKEVLAKI